MMRRAADDFISALLAFGFFVTGLTALVFSNVILAVIVLAGIAWLLFNFMVPTLVVLSVIGATCIFTHLAFKGM